MRELLDAAEDWFGGEPAPPPAQALAAAPVITPVARLAEYLTTEESLGEFLDG